MESPDPSLGRPQDHCSSDVTVASCGWTTVTRARARASISHWGEIFYSISSPMEESQLVAAAGLLWLQPEVCWTGENFAEPAHELH